MKADEMPDSNSLLYTFERNVSCLIQGFAEVNHGVDVVDSRLDVWGKRRKFYQCRGVSTPQTMAATGSADKFVAARFTLPKMQTGAALARFATCYQLAAFTR